MTCELTQYQSDGANFQSKSVLAAVQYLSYNLEGWKVTRWDNCREQGYTIYKNIWGEGLTANQLNITFCEYRNSDDIIVYVWYKRTFNAPTLFDIQSSVSSGTWMEHDSKIFGCLKIKEAAEYIIEMMEDFETSNETDPNQN
jgi:hypothetical protein